MIYLLPIGDIDLSVLVSLERSLKIAFEGFNINVDQYPEEIQLEDLDYDVKREQFHGSMVLQKISKVFREKYFFRILGVIDKDIYTKNYNFIFGTANVLSKISLISITRLRDEFYKELGVIYKKPTINDKFDLRVSKEAIHELGHTFGLTHCVNSCVMNKSNSLADTDNKPVNFCHFCLSKLNLDEA